MRRPAPLRRYLAAAYHQRRGFRGNVDGLADGALAGWVIPTDPALYPLEVGLFTSRGLLVQGVANIHRGDLEQPGLGEGHGRYGFALPITEVTRTAITAAGGEVKVKALGQASFTIGRLRLDPVPAGSGKTHAPPPMNQALHGDLARLEALLEDRENSTPERPVLARHGAMFANTDYLSNSTLPAPLVAYQDYVRYRNRYDRSFPLDDPDNARRFLRFYVDFFGPARHGLRIPLAAEQIARLNEPITLDTHPFELSRITWSYLTDYPLLRNSMDLSNPDWCFSVSYWWSIHQASSLHMEDCLVPAQYIARLAEIREKWAGKPWPLTRFMERYHTENPFLHGLDPEMPADRETLTLALLVKAVGRPDFLRYLPESSLDIALDENAEESPFSRFLAEMAEGSHTPVSREDYARALRLRGFDLATRSFLTFTKEGHRLEAAARPLPPADEVVDLQMIGPFRKASGLGQASRLSAGALEAVGQKVNVVDFGLDNPAPEGFSSEVALSTCKRARVNLIHLNAESIPLAFAYQPDVFSGAYNIGYFFWELDSPAACHYLGLDLLDEIWVSTEYGVEIYQPAVDIPVTNVGMCFEDLPEISRAEGRAFVAEHFGFDDDLFVFFVAFDSFSFVQRKNPVGTLKAFAEAFEGDKNVRLVIKTQNRRKVADPVQIAIWEEVDALIAADARIVLMDETLKYEDLLRLKKGCDAYVSLHRSEGWGFGMIEAMNLGVPVVATSYSGNMDFCSDETAWLVDYRLVELKPDEYIFVRPGQKWAEPDHASAVAQLRAVRADPEARAARANAARKNVRENFSAAAIGARYKTRLDEIFARLDADQRGKEAC